MVNSCAAAGCTNRGKKNGNRAFHKFPINNSELYKKWIVAIKRETFIPTERSTQKSKQKKRLFLKMFFVKTLVD